MIVKGIVTTETRNMIRHFASQHGLREGVENEFRTWTEVIEGEETVWVELDVAEDLYTYLFRTGFFDPDRGQSIQHLQCLHCGNSDMDRMYLQVEKPGYSWLSLQIDSGGDVYAEERRDSNIYPQAVSGTALYCQNCRQLFSDPGLPIRFSEG